MSSSSSSGESSSSGASSSGASSSSSGGPGKDAGPDAAATGTGSIVTVSGYQLMVQARNPDGTLAAAVPWDMKGIAWSPPGEGEGFLGPKGYSMHAAQDLPLMKAAHINTVRTYDSFETTAAGLAVLDQLHESGMMVAMTVMATYDGNTYSQAVSAFKDHPAVLLWIVGNEWNYNKLYSSHTYDECAQKVNDVVTAIHALDPDHPVATGYGQLPSAAQLAQVSTPDLWALNIYVTPNLGVAPDLYGFGTRFSDWKALSAKPFFVSEYGADAYNNKTGSEDQASQAAALGALTQEVRKNLSAADAGKVCVGGCPFEWNDEWWKVTDPATHDTGGSANVGDYPDGFGNEEWWGIVTADRTPRAAFTTLQALYK
jgi:hypothetical protein